MQKLNTPQTQEKNKQTINLIIHSLVKTLKPTNSVACYRLNSNFWIAFLFPKMSTMVNQDRVNCTQIIKIIDNFKLNNFEQCQKLTKQKGKTYTIREALAYGEAKVDWGIPNEQLFIMEQVHAIIIMILLLKDLQNHKAKNQVWKNC
jgi:hypothetical protein